MSIQFLHYDKLNCKKKNAKYGQSGLLVFGSGFQHVRTILPNTSNCQIQECSYPGLYNIHCMVFVFIIHVNICMTNSKLIYIYRSSPHDRCCRNLNGSLKLACRNEPGSKKWTKLEWCKYNSVPLLVCVLKSDLFQQVCCLCLIHANKCVAQALVIITSHCSSMVHYTSPLLKSHSLSQVHCLSLIKYISPLLMSDSVYKFISQV